MICSISVLVANSYLFFVGFCDEIRTWVAEISSSKVFLISLYFSSAKCATSSSASLTFASYAVLAASKSASSWSIAFLASVALVIAAVSFSVADL
ncbi:hypothetical protein AMIKIPNL_00587 [Mycoplasmopsis arginini]|nr:hypothetical protein [Mycoplasmopsis arginini]MDI3352048.1 hypothetical protein [Mycoplasmopsis arginini]